MNEQNSRFGKDTDDSQQNTVSRRDWATSLFSTLGAVTVVGCLPQEDGPDLATAEISQQLTMEDLLGFAGNELVVPEGIHLLATSGTVSANLRFAPGAKLKPASGVVVKLIGAISAGLYQIFDLSAGGGAAVEFGGRVPEVWVEWWGAKADGEEQITTDNRAAIQAACDAIQPTLNTSRNGGTVHLGHGGIYMISGPIRIWNWVVLKGLGTWTQIKANVGSDFISDHIFHYYNEAPNPIPGQSNPKPIAQFFCRLESLSINANDNPAIKAVIRAEAWQESCGMRDVVINKFVYTGLSLYEGHGGAVGCVLRDVQFFASEWADVPCGIAADLTNNIAGWYDLVLDGVSIMCRGAGSGTMECGTDPFKGVGVYATGRIRIDCRHVLLGEAVHGIYLTKDASLFGTTLSGDCSTRYLIGYDGGWRGKIDISSIRKGQAATLLGRFDGSYRFNGEPTFGRLQFPHSPSEVLAYAKISSGSDGLTTLTAPVGLFSEVVQSPAGYYRLIFDQSVFAPHSGGSYLTKVHVDSVNGMTWFVAGQSASEVHIQFKESTTGAAAPCSEFYVEIAGNPVAGIGIPAGGGLAPPMF